MTFELYNQSTFEFSVSEISNKIKEILEDHFGYIRVKGEISGLKIASSGHGYFNLKENASILACTCWRPILAKIKFPLSDGMEVVVNGKLTAYAGNSRYQLSVERIEPAGIGAMMQILRERKEQLEKEGLFNKIKKPLPFLPEKIGVVTSITGAVIRDIIHRITDRFPCHILIWPVSVQGESAGSEIAGAIEGFNLLDKTSRPDIIIVARGGGSIEDLWSFNDEEVVRSCYISEIPIISAVGHEVDYTLIDLVADKRAPTPTAAAEFAVPEISTLYYTLRSLAGTLINRINHFLKYEQQNIGKYDRVFQNFVNYVNYKQQLLDDFSFRLTECMPNLIKLKQTKLEQFAIERINPTKIVNYKMLELAHNTNSLIKVTEKILDNLKHTLNLNSKLLESLDYNNVLRRGYAIVQSSTGTFLPSKKVASAYEEFNIKFFDGTLTLIKEQQK